MAEGSILVTKCPLRCANLNLPVLIKISSGYPRCGVYIARSVYSVSGCVVYLVGCVLFFYLVIIYFILFLYCLFFILCCHCCKKMLFTTTELLDILT